MRIPLTYVPLRLLRSDTSQWDSKHSIVACDLLAAAGVSRRLLLSLRPIRIVPRAKGKISSGLPRTIFCKNAMTRDNLVKEGGRAGLGKISCNLENQPQSLIRTRHTTQHCGEKPKRPYLNESRCPSQDRYKFAAEKCITSWTLDIPALGHRARVKISCHDTDQD